MFRCRWFLEPMTTIRERTIEWLIDHGPGRFTVNHVAKDLGLSRRQTLNSLHGLARGGLTHQLARSGSGMWEYTPPDVHQWRSKHVDVERDDGQRPTLIRELPMGFVAHFRVVARVGDTYLIQGCENTDLYAWFKPIHGPIEQLRDD